MATQLYATFTPAQAHSILTSGVYTPLSLRPMDREASLTLHCCDLAGEALALRPGATLDEGGVGLVFKWLGEEECLEGWGAGPSPDILYHEYRTHELVEEPTYQRSLVVAGTRINFRLESLVFDDRALRHHLLARSVPKPLLPPRWRSMNKRIRDLADNLTAHVPDCGLNVRLDGPSLGLRRIHDLYAAACIDRAEDVQKVKSKDVPGITAQKHRDRDDPPEVHDVARYLLRSLNIPYALTTGGPFTLIPNTELYMDAYALSSLGPQHAQLAPLVEAAEAG
ncbi:hypothetical protein [Halomonas sp. KO116]|uniref:hypothetical protein n=1 Tax=Halomonas sp. KO116 TaxID=1504981 RepID=UPI0004E35B22|nr:hypothetical protein [Halomonas sp. KO116]AJY53314.1 hypothetical protein KO116_P200207 [Halomonas sp. KO116]